MSKAKRMIWPNNIHRIHRRLINADSLLSQFENMDEANHVVIGGAVGGLAGTGGLMAATAGGRPAPT